MIHSYDLAGMFLLGLLGSGHCMGMCGPIVVALSSAGASWRANMSAALYQGGRVTTYTAIGAVAGALGAGAGGLVPLARVQVIVTLVGGLLLGAFGLVLLRVVGEPSLLYAGAARMPLAGRLMRKVVQQRGGLWSYPLGLVLGFLPCGLSMAAFTRALTAAGALNGAALVAAFAAGTLPAMLAVSWLGSRLRQRGRELGQLIAGLILIAMAAQHLSRALRAIASF